jgi:ornithine cyclodeaminase/alanine dehydrogenase-like protein (mu-crystallin family)
MITLTRSEIEALIDFDAAAQAIKAAYVVTSLGQVNLPPVGHITFAQGADCHIKYGHMAGDANFVIKVATGFPENDAKGLPSGNGLVLVLSAVTEMVEAMLHDEMMLTDIRTGIGGAIASRALARADSRVALVVGTGPQARRQIEAHAALMPNLSFQVWGRASTKVDDLIADLAPHIGVKRAYDLEDATRSADVVITATGSKSPILKLDWVQPGTHITAVGADAPGKQELEIGLVARADVLAVDLVAQCLDHGEVSHAAAKGLITADDLHEIGTLLNGTSLGRVDDSQITMTDLTGIAAQDIAMANTVLAASKAQAA